MNNMFNGCAVRIKDGAHTMPLKHATLENKQNLLGRLNDTLKKLVWWQVC
jgi:hypothetical protein